MQYSTLCYNRSELFEKLPSICSASNMTLNPGKSLIRNMRLITGKTYDGKAPENAHMMKVTTITRSTRVERAPPGPFGLRLESET